MDRWKQLTANEMTLLDHVFWSSRISTGHPEGFLEAFANVYAGVVADVRARLEGRRVAAAERGYADVEAGARGVRFIEATVASSKSDRKWTAVPGAGA